jgi:hypothetical protein
MDKDLLSAASTWDTSSQGQSPRIELPGTCQQRLFLVLHHDATFLGSCLAL